MLKENLTIFSIDDENELINNEEFCITAICELIS